MNADAAIKLWAQNMFTLNHKDGVVDWVGLDYDADCRDEYGTHDDYCDHISNLSLRIEIGYRRPGVKKRYVQFEFLDYGPQYLIEQVFLAAEDDE